MTYRIAILGDFNPTHTTQHALNDSIRHIQKRLNKDIQCDWIGTDVFDSKVVFNGRYCGLWVVPGSPYKSMENVISVIEYTRVNHIPTFGICAGFQHMLIEFARNVCGITNADHEETSFSDSDFVISKLSCSLVRKEEKVTIADKKSKLYNLIKKKQITGRYFCNYGLNNNYIEILKQYGLSITALSPDGEVRAFELNSHPFFLGTLFQPTFESTFANPNPIILEFFKQCIKYSKHHQKLGE